MVDGLVVEGEQVKKVWQEAFRRLGTVDESEKAFDKDLMLEIKEEVTKEEELHIDSVCDGLNSPIKKEEVAHIIQQLQSGKAAGIDSLINEIFKYGGEAIGTATWRLCEEMFRPERIPARIAIVVSLCLAW